MFKWIAQLFESGEAAALRDEIDRWEKIIDDKETPDKTRLAAIHKMNVSKRKLEALRKHLGIK